MIAVVAVLCIVVVLLAVMVVGLLRSHAEILRALHDLGVNLSDGAPQTGTPTFALRSRAAGAGGSPSRLAADPPTGALPEGTPAAGRVGPSGLALPEAGALGDAHDLMGTTPGGDGVAVAVRDRPGLSLLAFLSSGCGTCMDFWDAFRDPANRRVGPKGTNLVVITRGPEAESPAEIAQLADPALTTLLSSEAWEDYSVPVAPYFVLVDGATSRIVGEGAATSHDQLDSLLSRALADGGYGLAARRSRRDVLRGGRPPDADEALAAADIGPGHPSLYEDPDPSRRSL